MISIGNPSSLPLHASAEKNQAENIIALVQIGADVNQREDGKGQTALHIAAALNHIASINALLSCGALVDVKDKDGETPLSLATKLKQTEAIELLLRRKVAPQHDGPQFLTAGPINEYATTGGTKLERRKAKLVLDGPCPVVPHSVPSINPPIGNSNSPGTERRLRSFTLAEERGPRNDGNNKKPSDPINNTLNNTLNSPTGGRVPRPTVLGASGGFFMPGERGRGPPIGGSAIQGMAALGGSGGGGAAGGRIGFLGYSRTQLSPPVTRKETSTMAPAKIPSPHSSPSLRELTWPSEATVMSAGGNKNQEKKMGEEQHQEYRKKATHLICQLRDKWAEERKKNGELVKEVRELKEQMEQLKQQQQNSKNEADSKEAARRERELHEKREREKRETVVMLKEGFSLDKLRLEEEIQGLKYELQTTKKKYVEMVEVNENITQKLEKTEQSRDKWLRQCRILMNMSVEQLGKSLPLTFDTSEDEEEGSDSSSTPTSSSPLNG